MHSPRAETCRESRETARAGAAEAPPLESRPPRRSLALRRYGFKSSHRRHRGHRGLSQEAPFSLISAEKPRRPLWHKVIGPHRPRDRLHRPRDGALLRPVPADAPSRAASVRERAGHQQRDRLEAGRARVLLQRGLNDHLRYFGRWGGGKVAKVAKFYGSDLATLPTGGAGRRGGGGDGRGGGAERRGLDGRGSGTASSYSSTGPGENPIGGGGSMRPGAQRSRGTRRRGQSMGRRPAPLAQRMYRRRGASGR